MRPSLSQEVRAKLYHVIDSPLRGKKKIKIKTCNLRGMALDSLASLIIQN